MARLIGGVEISLFTTMLEATAFVQRATLSRDSAQGQVQDPFTTISGATPLPCSQQEPSAHIKALYAQNNAEVPTTVYFPVNPRAEPNDRLKITDRNGYVNYYLVQGQSQPVGRGRLWGVDCIRIRAPIAAGQPGGD